MKSPFLGMDPYLETRWSDVHSCLTIYSRDALGRSLPPGLVARAEERTIVSYNEVEQRTMIPDVAVLERGQTVESVGSDAAGDVATAESICLRVEDEPDRQRFLEIRDARTGGQVITVIEFVSPSNKRPGDGLDQYRRKQRECWRGGVNLVEIDLTRGGDRSLIMPVHAIPAERQTTYLAAVFRAREPSKRWIYLIPLREKLAGIPIPLRPEDKEIVLDLQALIDQVYENGRYDQDLTYTEDLSPALSESDAEWVKSLTR